MWSRANFYATLLPLIMVLTLTAIINSPAALAAPEAKLSASKLQGPAPLAVFFDATETTDTNALANSFRDYLYSFHFGDNESGMWEHSGKSKNMQVGAPIAAHVFDKPGDYKVSLIVTDKDNNKSTATLLISVSSADNNYAGTKTVFLSINESTENVPEGADVRTFISSWPEWSSDTRYILMSDQDFTFLGRINIKQISGWQIISSDKSRQPVIDDIRIESGNPSATNWARDGVIMGLNAKDLDLGNSNQNILIYKNTINSNIQNGSTVDYWFLNSASHEVRENLHWPKQTFLVENVLDLNKTAGMGYYGLGSETALLGNRITRPTQHNIRLPLAYKAIISHNKLAGAGATHHEVKIHSRGTDAFSNLLSATSKPRSRYITISYNLVGELDSLNPWPIALAPQNGLLSEGIEDGIVEYNEFAKANSQDVSLGGRRLIERDNFITNNPKTVVAKGNQHAGALSEIWNGPYFVDDQNAPQPTEHPYITTPSVLINP